MVEVSTTIFPVPRAGSAVSGALTTAGQLGRQRIVVSLASATPSGSRPSCAPKASASFTGPGLRDATGRWWPASTRCRAIGRPLAPSPIKPTCIAASSGRLTVPVTLRTVSAAMTAGGTTTPPGADEQGPLLSFAVPDALLQAALSSSRAEEAVADLKLMPGVGEGKPPP